MIKNRNEKQHGQDSKEVERPAACDIQVDRYVLKEVVTTGSVQDVKTKIAEKLIEASRAGYLYIDRIPANSSESVLIFERINK